MDASVIRRPIASEYAQFVEMFNNCLDQGDGLLRRVLNNIGRTDGKRMRPILMLLIAKNFGEVGEATLRAAVGLELLHTASIVHDDVVDESGERRGSASVNAGFGNKVAVLTGDYILSTALLQVALTHSERIIRYLAELGQILSNGEIQQLDTAQSDDISEKVYYEVIQKKTAALFEACCVMGAVSVGHTGQTDIEEAKAFGHNLGIIFQIRDDIFDYYDSEDIGKPTGNDMAEGKLTLPAIYVINKFPYDSIRTLAKKVKNGTINRDEIAILIEFAKVNGGIDYAERKMNEYHRRAMAFINDKTRDEDIRRALIAYLDYVREREK